MTRPDTTRARQKSEVGLDRDVFTRDLIRELAGTLEDAIGLEDASDFISVFGQFIGEKINTGYRNALALQKLDREQVGDVLVDLKRRIQGDFFILEETIAQGAPGCRVVVYLQNTAEAEACEGSEYVSTWPVASPTLSWAELAEILPGQVLLVDANDCVVEACVFKGSELREAPGILARAVEANSGGMLVSILLSEDGRRLRHLVAPGLPQMYTEAIDGLKTGDRPQFSIRYLL